MRSPNATKPTPPGLLLTLLPHERAFLRRYAPGGGYQGLVNWLLDATARDGSVWLNPIMQERLQRCCQRYGPGGPQSRLRAACIPAFRRAGIELLPHWRTP